MNHKEMRQALREAGKPVPRSNKDTETAYAELIELKPIEVNKEAQTFAKEAESIFEGDAENIEPVVKLVSSNIYTYVGKGDEPPHKIKFKGVQWFTRGIAVEVKPSILEDVSKNASFVKGKVEMDVYYEKDEEEKAKAANQRDIDRQIQMQADRVSQRG